MKSGYLLIIALVGCMSAHGQEVSGELEQADAYLLRGKLDEAINAYRRVLQQDEEPVDEENISAEDRAILEAYENRIRRNAPEQRVNQPSKGDLS